MTVAYNEQELVWQLQCWGIHYLTGDLPPASLQKSTDVVALIQTLCSCASARVRDASISLFLLHPELAEAIMHAYQQSEPDVAEQIAVHTLAALYLQRYWSIRLALAFAHRTSLPQTLFSSFWRDRHLPDPDESFEGVIGLEALEHYEQIRNGWAYYQQDWQNQVEHLCQQQERWQIENKTLSTVSALSEVQPWNLAEPLPMRPDQTGWVTISTTDDFFTSVASVLQTPTDFYLADEATMIQLGIRPGLCIDFDAHIADSTPLWDIEARTHVPLHFINAERYCYPFQVPLRPDASLLKQLGLLTIHGIPITLIAFHKLWHGATYDIRDLVSLLHTGHLTLSALQETVTLVTTKYGRRATIEKDLIEQRFRSLWTVLQGKTPVI